MSSREVCSILRENIQLYVKNTNVINSLDTISNLINNNTVDLQEFCFATFGEKGIKKLVDDLNNENSEVRILALNVLINILYNNEKIQSIFCEIFEFTPVTNVVMLNFIPTVMKEIIQINEDILYDIRKSQCNVKPNIKYWMWPYSPKYNKTALPDPKVYLIGFYSIPKITVNFEDRGYNSIDKNEIIDLLEREVIENKENSGYNINKNSQYSKSKKTKNLYLNINNIENFIDKYNPKTDRNDNNYNFRSEINKNLKNSSEISKKNAFNPPLSKNSLKNRQKNNYNQKTFKDYTNILKLSSHNSFLDNKKLKESNDIINKTNANTIDSFTYRDKIIKISNYTKNINETNINTNNLKKKLQYYIEKNGGYIKRK